MRYAVQCTDRVTGKVGDFTFDEAQADQDRCFKATSPIFTSLQYLYEYCQKNVIMLDHSPYSFPAQPEIKTLAESLWPIKGNR